MNDDNSCCYFHPTEVVVGVCPLCLNERLLILAGHHHHRRHHHHKKPPRTATNNLPKIFAFGGSLLNRLELKQYWKSDHSNYSDQDASISQEGSFISIKFEDNGIASWEKAGTLSKSKSKSKVTLDHHASINEQQTNKTMMIEHAKPQNTLRWRKRIGHMFHVMRRKRTSSKANTCHVGNKVDGVKVGWIRTLTKRRTKE